MTKKLHDKFPNIKRVIFPNKIHQVILCCFQATKSAFNSLMPHPTSKAWLKVNTSFVVKYQLD